MGLTWFLNNQRILAKLREQVIREEENRMREMKAQFMARQGGIPSREVRSKPRKNATPRHSLERGAVLILITAPALSLHKVFYKGGLGKRSETIWKAKIKQLETVRSRHIAVRPRRRRRRRRPSPPTLPTPHPPPPSTTLHLIAESALDPAVATINQNPTRASEPRRYQGLSG